MLLSTTHKWRQFRPRQPRWKKPLTSLDRGLISRLSATRLGPGNFLSSPFSYYQISRAEYFCSGIFKKNQAVKSRRNTSLWKFSKALRKSGTERFRYMLIWVFIQRIERRFSSMVKLGDYDCIGFDLDNTIIQYKLSNLYPVCWRFYLYLLFICRMKTLVIQCGITYHFNP